MKAGSCMGVASMGDVKKVRMALQTHHALDLVVPCRPHCRPDENPANAVCTTLASRKNMNTGRVESGAATLSETDLCRHEGMGLFSKRANATVIASIRLPMACSCTHL